MTTFADPPERRALAMIGGFHQPPESSAHGSGHAAYLVAAALARSERFSPLDVYLGPHTAAGPEAGPLRLPAQARSFDLSSLRSSPTRYAAVYAANGVQLSSSPHVLRPPDDWAPVICTVGTAHTSGQWAHLFLSFAAGAIRPGDGFVFKSKAAQRLFLETWRAWADRFGFAATALETTVIGNGVDVDIQRASPKLRDEMRRRLRIANDDVVFLGYSRLSPGTKGDLQALVVRWRDVLARAPRALLVLAGAVVDRGFVADLRHLARAAGVSERVLIVDNPSEWSSDARGLLMSGADAFVHVGVGVEETSPLVVHEAMAHGLPVIATDWAGIGETVVGGETGFLLATEAAPLSPFLAGTVFGLPDLVLGLAASRVVAVDWRAFAAAVVALQDPEIRQRLGQAGRQRAVAGNITAVAGRHADFIAETSRRARALRAEPLVPVVALDAVIRAQASGALVPETEVRLGEPERAALLENGVLAESGPRLQALLAAFTRASCWQLGALAALLLPEQPPAQAFATCGRLFVRCLNFGLLARVDEEPSSGRWSG